MKNIQAICHVSAAEKSHMISSSKSEQLHQFQSILDRENPLYFENVYFQ